MTSAYFPHGVPDWSLVTQALSDDPALQPFVRGGALLIWSLDGRHLLFADANASILTGAPPESVTSPAHARLQRLGTGLAPRTGVRLERLQLLPGLSGALVTCACRRLPLGPGAEALLTALSAQELRRVAPHAAAQGDRPSAASPATAAADSARMNESLAPAPETARPQRFTWESDRDGVIVKISPSFAAFAGAEAASRLVGRNWDDLLASDVAETGTGLKEALDSARTWSGRQVIWRLADPSLGRRVQLSAAVTAVDGEFAGFCGFGLVAPGPAEPFTPTSVTFAQTAFAGQSTQDAETVFQHPGTEVGLADGGVTASGGGSPERAGASAAKGQAPLADITETGGELADDTPQTAAPEPSAPVRAIDAPAKDVARLRLVPSEPSHEAPREPPQGNLVPLYPPSRRQGPAALSPDQPEAGPDAKPALTPTERNAFREIAQALGARIDHDMRRPPAGVPLPAKAGEGEAVRTGDVPGAAPPPSVSAGAPAQEGDAAAPRRANDHARILDKMPMAVIIRRGERIVYANRTMLDLLDYADIDDLNAADEVKLWLAAMPDPSSTSAGSMPVTLPDRRGETVALEAHAREVSWKDEPAILLSFRQARAGMDTSARIDALGLDIAQRDDRINELTAVLDTATDGVVSIDERGRILSLNRSAEALFGFDQREVTGELFTLLLAPESHTRALDYLEGLKGGGVASVLNDGREVMGRVRQGGRITLFMTLGQIAGSARPAENGRKFCAVLRDITAWKRTELELVEARKQAEKASAQKSDVLAKISHEIRTPLNAIIGFSEVMAQERFGPIGNDRYKEYLRDIHESGGYVISLVNDLLDLAKIEAGKLDLDFVSVNLNDIAAHSVALLQPEAQRGRVVLRSGLAPKLPPVVADERSIRQIMINILSNAVKFTDAGGQVIISSALGDKGEAIIRVRDTGIGMSEADLKLALEPFRQVPSTRKAGGTGLGLPLTKALVEANRAALSITSARNEGTLIEIIFPPQRVLAS